MLAGVAAAKVVADREPFRSHALKLSRVEAHSGEVNHQRRFVVWRRQVGVEPLKALGLLAKRWLAHERTRVAQK